MGAHITNDPLLVSLGLIVAVLVVLGAVLSVSRIFLHRLARIRHGFHKKLLLVTVPKESAEKKDAQQREKSLQEIQEDIGVADALFAAIGGLHAERSLSSWFFGRSDEFSFEIVAHGGLISFYIAAPERQVDFLTKQIYALYPHAHVEDSEDYNIFSPRGAIAGGYMQTKREHYFPLKTYRKSEADPIEPFLSVLSKIGKENGAAIQYVVRSAKRGWRKKGAKIAVLMQKGKTVGEAEEAASFWGGFMGAFKTKKKEEAGGGTRFLSPLETEMQKGIQEKASKAGLDANIRIMTSAPDAPTANRLLMDLMNAAAQYNYYEFGNALMKNIPFMKQRLIRDFIYRSFNERRESVLSTDELASMFHMPLPTTEVPNIRWLVARKGPPPSNLPSDGLILGKVIYRGDESLVRIKREDRRRHLYVVGKSGTGKSVFIENMVVQDIENGEGVCVVDPHGDLIESILARVPKNRIEDVIVFDPSDVERPVGLNMLEVKRPDQKDFAVQEMISIFYKLFPPEMIGPMFEHNMRNVMLTLMADPATSGTLAEIPRMFTDQAFAQTWVDKLTDPIVRSFWEKEMAKTSDFHKSEMLGYLISKVGRFVENEMMRNIIGQRESGFDLREVMDKKKILLVNLAKGRTGEVNSNLLGLIIVSKLQMAALSRADLPEAERHDFYLYIDEFQNFITPSIATILSEARKYRLNLIIAHQFMGQLIQEGGKTEIRDAVLGNAGTLAVFRIGVEDTETLEKEFVPTFNSYDLINAEKYTAYVKLLIDNTASKPFNMQTLAPAKGDSRIATAIKQLSRLKHGRDKRIVEADIMERAQLGEPTRAIEFSEKTL